MKKGSVINIYCNNWQPESFINIRSKNESNLTEIIQGDKLIILINGEKYSIKIKKEEE